MYEPTDDVVAFIASYMNESHPDALRDIVAAHGLSAQTAAIVGMTVTHLSLRVLVAGEHRSLEIEWPAPLTRREDIRMYLQEMQDEARFGS